LGEQKLFLCQDGLYQDDLKRDLTESGLQGNLRRAVGHHLKAQEIETCATLLLDALS
jgi:hypothetical protein